MQVCTSCGARIEAGQRFCTECGAPVQLAPAADPWPPADDQTPISYQQTAVYEDPPGLKRPLIIGLVIAVVAALAVVAFLVLRDDDEVTPITSATQSGVGATTALPSQPASTTAPAETVPPNGPSTFVPPPAPGQTPYWTVIVSSLTDAEGGRAAAEAVGQRLLAAGYQYDIFHSSAHTSLRPGYWVTAIGRLTSADAASDLSGQVDAAGFDTYPRCVGTADECA